MRFLAVLALASLFACSKDEPKPTPPAGSSKLTPSASAAASNVLPMPVAPSSVAAVNTADAAPVVWPDDPRTKAWKDYTAPEELYFAKFPKPPTIERKEGVPSFVTARLESAKFPAGDLLYVTAMLGRSREPPPPEMAFELLDMVQKVGFEGLGMTASSPKPFTDPYGNSGRDLKVAHKESKREGVGRVLLDLKNGAFLITIGYGPNAEAFVASTHVTK